jgi:hypothetical protein
VNLFLILCSKNKTEKQGKMGEKWEKNGKKIKKLSFFVPNSSPHGL